MRCSRNDGAVDVVDTWKTSAFDTGSIFTAERVLCVPWIETHATDVFFLTFQMMCHSAKIYQWILEAIFCPRWVPRKPEPFRRKASKQWWSEVPSCSNCQESSPLDRMAMRSWWPARSFSGVCIVLLMSVRDAQQHEGSSSIKFHLLFLWCHLVRSISHATCICKKNRCSWHLVTWIKWLLFTTCRKFEPRTSDFPIADVNGKSAEMVGVLSSTLPRGICAWWIGSRVPGKLF